ncbi:MAG: redoxin family protein [Fimbriimonas sp.]
MMKQIGLLMAFAMVTGAGAQQPPLRVGSPAPTITVAKWVKGGPVVKKGDGKVHVVEFWATWCGPCLDSIPHLTEMAKKYKGKASFNGISISEAQKDAKDTSYIAKVDKFVKNMGTKMNYNVGVDGPTKVMAKRWMEAAGQDGIPTAFVIDRQGKIAWIGHPMSGLDEVVGQVVAGTFNAKAEAARKAKVEAEERARLKLMEPIVTAYQKEDWPTVASESERLMKAKPEMAEALAMIRYEGLIRGDDPRAYDYAKEIGESLFRTQPGLLNQIAWMIVDPEANLKAPKYEVAVALGERAVALSKEEDANILDTLALALWKQGNKTRALAMQAKAVKIANADPQVSASSKKEILARYEMMKKG